MYHVDLRLTPEELGMLEFSVRYYKDHREKMAAAGLANQQCWEDIEICGRLCDALAEVKPEHCGQ